MEEDIEKHHEPYLHREHHLQGVSVCNKHQTPLLKYIGKRGHECEYNRVDYTEMKSEIDLSNRVLYAEYSHKILKACLNTCLDEIRLIISNEIEQYSYSVKEGREGFTRAFMESGFNSFSKKNILDFDTGKLFISEYVGAPEVLPILMFLYPDINKLRQKVSAKQEWLKVCKCPVCGYKYCSTLWLEEHGWECPQCDYQMNIQDFVSRLVERSGKNRYVLRSEFSSMDGKVMLYHKDCKKERPFLLRSFLFNGTRCICESTITPETAKTEIEKNKGFILKKFINTNQPITIYHTECCHTFTCNYHKFIQHPHCHYCTPRYMDTEEYKKRIRQLVGDEYTLISSFVDQKTKIEIQHNICGKSKWYQPNHFLEGQRCPICAKVSDEWMNMYQFLEQYRIEYGNVAVPKRQVYREIQLGTWCQHQRQDYKNGVLTEKQVELLSLLKFDFDPLETEWDRRYEQYKRYIAETGSAKIARRRMFEGEHLGTWVYAQQKRYRLGKLSPIRREKLLAIASAILE